MAKPPKQSENNISLTKISHELRNPIHGLNGLANYLNDNWDSLDQNTKKTCIDNISKTGNIIENLIDKLFQYTSFNNNGEILCVPKNTNLVKLAQEAIDEIQLSIKIDEPINIFLECEEKEINLMIDELWVNRLLSNLISNAKKHSGAKNIKVQIDSAKDNVVVSVIDDGMGIPQSELESIFEPFVQSSTTRGSEKGSGLGLTICQDVVAAHNGSIVARNNNGTGATISFTLPKKVIDHGKNQ
jgi:signal transduction histidine kinase